MSGECIFIHRSPKHLIKVQTRHSRTKFTSAREIRGWNDSPHLLYKGRQERRSASICSTASSNLTRSSRSTADVPLDKLHISQGVPLKLRTSSEDQAPSPGIYYSPTDSQDDYRHCEHHIPSLDLPPASLASFSEQARFGPLSLSEFTSNNQKENPEVSRSFWLQDLLTKDMTAPSYSESSLDAGESVSPESYDEHDMSDISSADGVDAQSDTSYTAETVVSRFVEQTFSHLPASVVAAGSSQAIKGDDGGAAQTPATAVIPTLSANADMTHNPAYAPVCSFMMGCITNSPFRKVVSHIFGRNKLCTRQIPDNIWYHYCRKHYQRVRYRNPRGFAQLQCDLVHKQICRLEDWAGIPLEWTVKIRKREELRLSMEQQVPNNSETHTNNDNSAELNNLKRPRHAHGFGTTSSDRLARWISTQTGSGKTTAEVLEIVKQMDQELARTGASFPEIEILPDLSSMNPKAGAKPSELSRAASIAKTRRLSLSNQHPEPTRRRQRRGVSAQDTRLEAEAPTRRSSTRASQAGVRRRSRPAATTGATNGAERFSR